MRKKWSAKRLITVAASVAISLSFLAAGWTSGLLKTESVKEAEAMEELAREFGITDYYVQGDGWFRDKVELTPLYGMVVEEIEILAKKEMEDSSLRMGKIHKYELIKKQLLKKKYGIDWRTTQEMNPHVCID